MVDGHEDELSLPRLDLGGVTLGAALLEPTRIYVKPVLDLLRSGVAIKGMAHITGGGITENLPRIFPAGLGARIDRRAWDVPPLFRFLRDAGRVPTDDMYRSFNMGIGLIVACRPAESDRVVAILGSQGERPRVIGEMIAGERTVSYAQ
jgi:phosphoribosylformylglycinamidine cyclo-ligase